MENDITFATATPLSLKSITMLSEEVALLCPGFTGAEMKLLMKRSTSHCLNDEKNAITEIKNKRKNEEEKNEGKLLLQNIQ